MADNVYDVVLQIRDKASAALREIDREAVSARGGIKQVGDASASASREMQALGTQARLTFGTINASLRVMGQSLPLLLGGGGLLYGLRQTAQFSQNARVGMKLFGQQLALNNQNMAEGVRVLQQVADDLGLVPQTIADSATQLLRQGLNMQQIKILFEGAGASALAMGKSTAQGIDAVTQAVVNQQSIYLNYAGIAQNLNVAYVEMARQLGKTTNELTTYEKAQAAVNLVQRATAQELSSLPTLLSGYTGSTNQLNKAWTDFKLTVGDFSKQVLTPALRTITKGIEAFNAMPEPMKRAGLAAVVAAGGVTTLAVAVGALQTALAPLFGPVGLVLAAVGGVAALAAALSGRKDSLTSAFRDAHDAVGKADSKDSLVAALDTLSAKLQGDAKKAVKDYADEIRTATGDLVNLKKQANEIITKQQIAPLIAERDKIAASLKQQQQLLDQIKRGGGRVLHGQQEHPLIGSAIQRPGGSDLIAPPTQILQRNIAAQGEQLRRLDERIAKAREQLFNLNNNISRGVAGGGGGGARPSAGGSVSGNPPEPVAPVQIVVPNATAALRGTTMVEIRRQAADAYQAWDEARKRTLDSLKAQTEAGKAAQEQAAQAEAYTTQAWISGLAKSSGAVARAVAGWLSKRFSEAVAAARDRADTQRIRSDMQALVDLESQDRARNRSDAGTMAYFAQRRAEQASRESLARIQSSLAYAGGRTPEMQRAIDTAVSWFQKGLRSALDVAATTAVEQMIAAGTVGPGYWQAQTDFSTSLNDLAAKGRQAAQAQAAEALRRAWQGQTSFIDTMSHLGSMGRAAAIQNQKDAAEAAAKLEKRLRGLSTTVGKVDGIFNSLRSAFTAGTAGGVISGIAGAASGIADLIPGEQMVGQIVGQVGKLIGDIVDTITSLFDNGISKAKATIAQASQGIDLVSADAFTKIVERKQSPFLRWLLGPKYKAEIDKAAQNIARTLSSGIQGGLSVGLSAYLKGSADWLQTLKDGVKQAIIQGVVQAVVQGAIIKGALGTMLTQLTKLIAAGNWDAAGSTVNNIMKAIPALSERLARLLKPIKAALGESSDSGATTKMAGGITLTIPQAPSAVMAAPAWAGPLTDAANKLSTAVDRWTREGIRIHIDTEAGSGRATLTSLRFMGTQ